MHNSTQRSPGSKPGTHISIGPFSPESIRQLSYYILEGRLMSSFQKFHIRRQVNVKSSYYILEGSYSGPESAKCEQNYLGNVNGLQIHPNRGFRG